MLVCGLLMGLLESILLLFSILFCSKGPGGEDFQLLLVVCVSLTNKVDFEHSCKHINTLCFRASINKSICAGGEGGGCGGGDLVAPDDS